MPERSADHAALACRYVDALFDLAEKENAVDAVADDLRALRQLWDDSAEWRFISRDPRLTADAVNQAAASVVEQAGLSQLTANFISVVAQNRRLAALPAMIESFLDLVTDRRGEFRAEVRTARPLSKAQHDALAQSLNAIAGGLTHLTVTQDAGLIGGLTVKIGSKFIDASVKNRLDHLERSLKGAA